MFAPGVPNVMNDFNTSSNLLATFVVSIYVLGFAFGPLVVAPASELLGRSPVYHICTYPKDQRTFWLKQKPNADLSLLVSRQCNVRYLHSSKCGRCEPADAHRVSISGWICGSWSYHNRQWHNCRSDTSREERTVHVTLFYGTHLRTHNRKWS